MEIAELFEGGSPLARRVAAEGPYASAGDAIAAARRLQATLSEEEAIATLDAHPRIGENAARLSSASLREQGAEALPELRELNAAYERRFGFRFVVFVRGRSQREILEVLRARLDNDRDLELASGLRAVVDIAEDRLARR